MRDHGRCLVGRDVDGHRGRLGLQALGIHCPVAEVGNQRLRGSGGRGVGHRGGTVEHHAAQARTRLGQVAEGQRYVAVWVTVVEQQVQGQRHADTGGADIGLGQRRLVFRLDRCVAEHDHRLDVAAAMAGLDRDGRWRLGNIVDRQALQRARLGQAAIALGDQVRNHHFIAGAGLDEQALVGPVIARGADLDHVGQLARQRRRLGAPGAVAGRDHHHRRRCHLAELLAEEQPAVVCQQAELAG
ncbi:hypothetical protein D3C71_1436620 [compost metagenome]